MASGGVEVPSAAVLRAVAKPGLLLIAAPDLTKISAGLAVLVGLFTLNPVAGIFAFFPAHLVAVVLTYRDRYVVEVMKPGSGAGRRATPGRGRDTAMSRKARLWGSLAG